MTPMSPNTVCDWLHILCTYIGFSKNNGIFIPRVEADEVMFRVQKMLSHWSWLLQRSIGLGEPNWAVKPKLHVLWHICWHSRYLNPRWIRCHDFEDCMHSIKMAARACAVGTHTSLMGTSDAELFHGAEPIAGRFGFMRLALFSLAPLPMYAEYVPKLSECFYSSLTNLSIIAFGRCWWTHQMSHFRWS